MPQNSDSKKTGNILISSISRKTPMIEAVKKAAKAYDLAMLVYGADATDEVIGKYFVHKFWHMPRIDKLNTEEIITYCQTEHIQIIIPSRDGELAFWATQKKVLAEHGIVVSVNSLSAIQKCLDKLTFYQELAKLNLPVIQTSENIASLAGVSKFVVKERFGAGSENIGINLTKEQAEVHQSKLKVPVYQPYIKGTEYSLDLYITSKKVVKGVIARVRRLVINGESQITESVTHPKLEKLGAEIALALDLQGHVVLQILESENGQFHVIECNCRFGGASTLSLQCGLNSFYWAILEANGEDLDAYPFVRTENKKQIRYAQDLIL